MTLAHKIAGFLILIASFTACGGSVPGNVSSPVIVSATAQGARVESPVLITKEAMADLDAGLADQIQRMPADWTRGRAISDYRIRFVEPQTTNNDGSPAIFVQGVQTAGTVIGGGINRDNTPLTIVLPHQGLSGWQFHDYLRNSVHNEAEHYSEWLNDRATFYKYTGPNDRHPHRP